ncbi:hypothetical protein [Streptomyces chattanoogensis]|uniref:hypothetical protein n=1 Tax=Streptomyces chattanoogensis TaxID=66876 RepID=UPI0036975384
MRQLVAASAAFVPPLLAGCLLTSCLLAGCATPARRPAPDEVIKAATQSLTDACLTHQGLTPPRPGHRPPPTAGPPGVRPRDSGGSVTAALFGTGRAELTLPLPTGYVVRAHTDGCLAAAQRRLYGDQRRWFRASVTVNNLGPEAAHTHRSLAEVRARHRTEIADWRRLRAHALTEATALLDHRPPAGVPQP